MMQHSIEMNLFNDPVAAARFRVQNITFTETDGAILNCDPPIPRIGFSHAAHIVELTGAFQKTGWSSKCVVLRHGTTTLAFA
jgi:hypothetical protein